MSWQHTAVLDEHWNESASAISTPNTELNVGDWLESSKVKGCSAKSKSGSDWESNPSEMKNLSKAKRIPAGRLSNAHKYSLSGLAIAEGIPAMRRRKCVAKEIMEWTSLEPREKPSLQLAVQGYYENIEGSECFKYHSLQASGISLAFSDYRPPHASLIWQSFGEKSAKITAKSAGNASWAGQPLKIVRLCSV